ncbi:hypothetical protein EN829_032510 [Mesorhizobium sp. M00.F.Ca.ET.186.01.1.1]|nr:hypothetical protein EN848_32385 [bacterium M00.F.Ca.ET.205.01.1.1]TGU46042.1 hypothetical protein EN795_33060 [bacterium M00.F.Ca.ET.152.01.1.1]TGV31515.1 hypothetical protein EN829_032510 [Mesorhizobium sp. M00.F.Ca.ET.186.01.1.1]TGZ38719.1 hypothetical protein EN805_32330 [bacterium M00.F.Ca.ET.162.01.1.1]
MLTLAISTACSASDQIDQQSRTAASAAQTVAMALDVWAAGEAPSAYTLRTLQSVGKTLADVQSQIRSAGSAEPAEQAALAAAVGQMSDAVVRAEAGLQAGRRSEVQGADEDVRAAARSLAAAYARYFAPKS